MAITLYNPSDNWPAYYNSNLDQYDDVTVGDLPDVTLTDPIYKSSVLTYDSDTSMWVNSGILTSTLSYHYAVWDSTCKDSGAVLSRNDRVVYNNNSNYPIARATLGSDTVSKYYVEIFNLDCDIRCNSLYFAAGVGYITNCSDPKNNKEFWLYRGDGYLYTQSDLDAMVYVTSSPNSVGMGESVGIAVEVSGTTCKVWFRDAETGNWLSGDPETSSSPSFEFDTNGYEIFPMAYGASITYVELITKEEYMEYSVPAGFYELRTGLFSSTTTSSTT